jgi:HEAT repeat protein
MRYKDMAAAVDKAFDALKTYDWGADRNRITAIDDAVVATDGDAAARKELETRLAAVLVSGAPYDAKDYACRKLMIVATAESVPTLAALLPDEKLSHMARYALERIPAPAAAQALRDALAKVSGQLKVGVIGSLGVRRDRPCIAALAGLIGDADTSVACAAACALGNIGTPEAAQALAASAPTAADSVKPAVADARLASAERLLRDGNQAEAIGVYKSLAGGGQPKYIRLAAARGLLLAAGKKAEKKD